MKELKNYVCTFEQAEKLKELGVEQDSLFYFVEEYEVPNYLKGHVLYSCRKWCAGGNEERFYSLLPKITMVDLYVDMVATFTSQELIEIIANINDYALESYFDDVVYFKEENEAKERAAFLIDYLEMIKKEEDA